jgi:predicted nucleotidyltransferase
MSATSNPDFIPVRQPVDPLIAHILRVMDAVARTLVCDYLLVGATARDLIFINVFNLTGWRATRDVDFGIATPNWEAFELFRRAVLNTGQFDECVGRIHRLTYKTESGFAMPVDLIPFGGVAVPNDKIAWPPDWDVVMNVAGFTEALNAALHVMIATDLSVRVASVPALAIMKLLAWRDRRNESNKDATDFARMLQRYAAAGNEDRLYGECLPLLEAANFDIEVAGAILLGRDASAICSSSTHQQVRSELESEHSVDRLIGQIAQLPFDMDADTSRITDLVSGFRKGFLERDQTLP